MTEVIKADGKREIELLNKLNDRSESAGSETDKIVAEILTDVKRNGDSAVLKYTKRFDGCEFESMEVTKTQIEAAYKSVEPKLLRAMKISVENVRAFHERQTQQGFVADDKPGVVLGQIVRGLDRVGIYVPGGRASYPSSVIMNAVPAKVARVREIIMTTPPDKDGNIPDVILAAAYIAGVDRIFKTGGAQAIGALAYGTETIPRVDKIVGPGNTYVAAAKRMVFGQVDIDMIAGPSEVMVVADESGDAAYIAADLMSQAEHDPMASCILAVTDETLALDVVSQIKIQLSNIPKRDIISEAFKNYGAIVLFDSMDKALDFANMFAPEHLELMVENPMEAMKKIINAGSVFLGKYSPEPLGDYLAGPNHVLPTNGTARFFSPLSVDSFVKRMSFINYSEEVLAEVSGDIQTFAEAEGLYAHSNSIKVRMKK